MANSSFKSDCIALDDMAEFFCGDPNELKRRCFKKRRRRNRSNIFYLLESAGKISEESDTTDEALRDYMENIAAQQSDSDLESNMTKRLSSLRCQLNNLTNGCPDPYHYIDKAESDSCSEINYQKKRRKRKRKHKKMCGNNSSQPLSVTLQPSLFKVPPPMLVDSAKLRPAQANSNKHVILKAHRSRLNDDDFLADAENGHTSSCGENLNHMSCSVDHVQHLWPSAQGMDICDDSESETMHDSTHTPESSALSSSSDEELFTNDEGQLGDDEQEESCYETDSQCSWLRGRSNSDDEDEKFHKLYRETLEYLKSKPFFLEDDQGVLAYVFILKR
jgi:hypothetical protein